jgi:hypothetical protein
MANSNRLIQRVTRAKDMPWDSCYRSSQIERLHNIVVRPSKITIGVRGTQRELQRGQLTEFRRRMECTATHHWLACIMYCSSRWGPKSHLRADHERRRRRSAALPRIGIVPIQLTSSHNFSLLQLVHCPTIPHLAVLAPSSHPKPTRLKSPHVCIPPPHLDPEIAPDIVRHPTMAAYAPAQPQPRDM